MKRRACVRCHRCIGRCGAQTQLTKCEGGGEACGMVWCGACVYLRLDHRGTQCSLLLFGCQLFTCLAFVGRPSCASAPACWQDPPTCIGACSAIKVSLHIYLAISFVIIFGIGCGFVCAKNFKWRSHKNEFCPHLHRHRECPASFGRGFNGAPARVRARVGAGAGAGALCEPVCVFAQELCGEN